MNRHIYLAQKYAKNVSSMLNKVCFNKRVTNFIPIGYVKVLKLLQRQFPDFSPSSSGY